MKLKLKMKREMDLEKTSELPVSSMSVSVSVCRQSAILPSLVMFMFIRQGKVHGGSWPVWV